MKDPSEQTPDPKRVEKVAALLQQTFQDVSPVLAKVQARILVQSPDWSHHLHHHGARDRDELIRLGKALKAMNNSVLKLSPWTQSALEQGLHRFALDRSLALEEDREPGFDVPEPPLTVEEFQGFVKTWARAASSAEKSLGSGKPGHGKNYRAIALVDDARKAWHLHSGKSPPRRQLNRETRFAEFLSQLFDIVGVGAPVERAYDAWFDVADDPDSTLDPPGCTVGRIASNFGQTGQQFFNANAGNPAPLNSKR